MADLRLAYSESKIWLRDRRHWYLAYYRRLKPRAPDRAGSAFSIGNGYHDALAAYYESGADPVAFVEARGNDLLEATPEFEDDVVKETALLSAMASGYMEWLEETGADADLTIQGAERMIEVPLVEGITLLSKLDAPVERTSDGARLALEHKTTGSLDQPLPLLKLDRQFLTEHLARFMEMQKAGATAEEAIDRCQGILWNGARKVKRTPQAKPPFYARIDVPHNIIELRNHWKHMVAIGREIKEAREKLDAGWDHHVVCPPNPTRDSTWDNPFFKVAVLLDDGSDFEGALAEIYEEHDPLERYAGAIPV